MHLGVIDRVLFCACGAHRINRRPGSFLPSNRETTGDERMYILVAIQSLIVFRVALRQVGSGVFDIKKCYRNEFDISNSTVSSSTSVGRSPLRKGAAFRRKSGLAFSSTRPIFLSRRHIKLRYLSKHVLAPCCKMYVVSNQS